LLTTPAPKVGGSVVYNLYNYNPVTRFGFLTGLQAPQLIAGHPTLLMGFTERINIYATLLWFAVLSIALLRTEKARIRLN
jgi:hypothetical protein